MQEADFATIRAVIGLVRLSSVQVSADQPNSRAHWIPRALVHPDDNAVLDGKFTGERMAVRIVRTKAAEVGLLTERDDATKDLFRGANADQA